MSTCTTGLRPVDPDPRSCPKAPVASDARDGQARRGAGLLACAAALTLVPSAYTETGIEAWLRYAPLDEPALTLYRQAVPVTVLTLSDTPLQLTARDEIIRGIRGMLGRTLRIAPSQPAEPAIQIGTLAQLHLQATLAPESYWLKSSGRNILVAGSDDRGALYGAFALLRKIALGEPLANLDEKQSPRIPIRWVNEWDNLDGTIERGYGGRSIFWDNLHARDDLTRVADYARLLASLGINGCSINNVNANPRALASDFIPEIARIAAAFRPWGVRIAISVDFGSPKTIGGLDTFDPLDPKVAAWWAAKADELYEAIPDFGGIVLKADSEGRVGPPPTTALTPTPPTSSRARSSRMAACSSTAASSTTTTWIGTIPRTIVAAPPRTTSTLSTASSTTTPSCRSRTAPSISRCANPHRRSSAPSTRPPKPSSCKSRRNISDRDATPCFSSPCGKRRSISTCAKPPATPPR